MRAVNDVRLNNGFPCPRQPGLICAFVAEQKFENYRQAPLHRSLQDCFKVIKPDPSGLRVYGDERAVD
jgi:hypothetical protein